MPWNPEHYNKKKLLPLRDHYIPALTEKMKSVEEYGDFRDDIVNDEHHKPPKIKDGT